MNDKYERNLFQHSTGFYHKFYDFHHRKFTGNCLDVAAMATQIFLFVHKKMPQTLRAIRVLYYRGGDRKGLDTVIFPKTPHNQITFSGLKYLYFNKISDFYFSSISIKY